jgi:DNA repair exonuclease SbcCD ATPase subunit
MWVERITARSFGALRDESLELGPGLNVVFGPNEAGKSTWHAALRMALTGVRRGRGSTTREAAALEDRHRPWDDPDRWAVEARIHLAGRRIDLVQDLLGKVACRATDLDLGVDVSAEITRPDGTPDASIWLGLDREAFASTLAVGQGEMLAVADDAGALQEHMQRAAAAHGTDATAAGAIERLREHRRRAVGADTAVAKGPLRTAMRERDAREAELTDARQRHATYLEQLAAADAASHALGEAERRLSAARLARARSAAEAASRRLDRATELAGRHPTPPPELAARDEVADRVAAALAAVRGMAPEPGARAGRRPAEIEAELRALPPAPTGDLQPAESVLAAVRELELAAEAERALVAAANDRGAGARASKRVGRTLALAAALGLVAVVAIVAGSPLLGVLLGLLAGGLAAWSIWSGGQAPAEESSLAEGLSAARQRSASAQASLVNALHARGVDPGADPVAATVAYQSACLERAEEAARAATRPALDRELEAARAAERMATDRERGRLDAERELRAAADAAGIGLGPDASLPEVIAGLEAWRTERSAQAEVAERGIREYEELTGLLDGRTLADLEAEAERLSAAAAALETRAAPADFVAAGSAAGGPPNGAAVDEAIVAAEVERHREAAAALAGALEVRAADLIDVAEAEEAAAAARLRLERVIELAGIIDETMALLETAQRQVHRDLAPLLADAIREWLPVLSDGAYVEAGVNPADLSIEVKERATGAWRQARLLSGGTREQIYLLLRIAMAQHLVTTAESAPMLLDDVTAQADSDRREAILDMLLTMAADRQLVLFTHDDAVRAWAERRLAGDPHRLIELTPREATRPQQMALSVGSAP